MRFGVEQRLVVSEDDRGTRSSNSEPRSGPSVSDLMHARSPPIFRARPLATRSPSPNPSFCRVRESSSREKGLNKNGRKASGIPGPVSTTLMTINFAFGVRVALSEILPSSVNLMAFKKTQETSLARSRSSTVAFHQLQWQNERLGNLKSLPRIVSGTWGSTDHSMILVHGSPFEPLVLTSIISPPIVSSAIADSGLPPTLRNSLMIKCSRLRTCVCRSPGVTTADSGSDMSQAILGSMSAAGCRVRSSMPPVISSLSSTAVRRDAVWGETSRSGVEFLGSKCRCFAAGPLLPESLVLCRLLLRKKTLLPSTIMLGLLPLEETVDTASILSSSFGGFGVSGTCMFKSYA